MKIGREIAAFWLDHCGIRAIVRGVLLLALGALLLWEPILARRILIWIPVVMIGGCGLFCLHRSAGNGAVKCRRGWLAAGLILLGGGVGMLWLPLNRTALVCAACFVFLASAGLAAGAFRPGAKWATRVTGAIAAGLAVMLGVLVLVRKGVDFLPAADLIGIFLLAMGVLTLALSRGNGAGNNPQNRR